MLYIWTNNDAIIAPETTVRSI